MSPATSAATAQAERGAPSEDTLVDSEPYLFSRREYVETVDGSTTVCSLSVSSPVKEFGPDD